EVTPAPPYEIPPPLVGGGFRGRGFARERDKNRISPRLWRLPRNLWRAPARRPRPLNPPPTRGGGMKIASPHPSSHCLTPSNRSRAALAARRTLSGAVPPKLVRLAIERSTLSTPKTSAVMRDSTCCIAASGRSARPQRFSSANRTSCP